MIDYIDDCYGCPECRNCGRKHLEILRCDECGEVITDFDDYKEECGDHFHLDCWYNRNGYDESLTLENAKLYGDSHTEEIEINSFLFTQFSREDIEEILWREYKNGRGEEHYKDDVELLASQDKDEWVEEICNN